MNAQQGARRFDPAKLRARRGGLTQVEAARRCGISLSTYRSYEQGTTVPGADALASLADGLRTTIDSLFSEART